MNASCAKVYEPITSDINGVALNIGISTPTKAIIIHEKTSVLAILPSHVLFLSRFTERK